MVLYVLISRKSRDVLPTFRFRLGLEDLRLETVDLNAENVSYYVPTLDSTVIEGLKEKLRLANTVLYHFAIS